MTLTQLQKEVLENDIQRMSFNLGQCTLIDNILSMNWHNADELLMFIKVWKTKMNEETDEITQKYEELKK
jgi:hypothetical protein